MELGNLSVQIQTTRETSQHIDVRPYSRVLQPVVNLVSQVRDMFRHKVKGEADSQMEVGDKTESYPTPYKT